MIRLPLFCHVVQFIMNAFSISVITLFSARVICPYLHHHVVRTMGRHENYGRCCSCPSYYPLPPGRAMVGSTYLLFLPACRQKNSDRLPTAGWDAGDRLPVPLGAVAGSNSAAEASHPSPNSPPVCFCHLLFLPLRKGSVMWSPHQDGDSQFNIVLFSLGSCAM